jgi:hypothetical protein
MDDKSEPRRPVRRKIENVFAQAAEGDRKPCYIEKQR